MQALEALAHARQQQVRGELSGSKAHRHSRVARHRRRPGASPALGGSRGPASHHPRRRGSRRDRALSRRARRAPRSVSRQIRERVERTAGPQEAAIFDVQRSILDDQELIAGVEELIRQNLGAEKAFEIVMFEWTQRFADAPHPMLRERVGDLKDVEIRVLTLLLDLPGSRSGRSAERRERDSRHARPHAEPHGAARSRRRSPRIATDAGTRTSHVAILARSLGLPAVVGLRTATQELTGRETAILDGSTGTARDQSVALRTSSPIASARGRRKLAEAELRTPRDARRGHDRRRSHHAARERRSARGGGARRDAAAPRALGSCAPSSSSSAARRCPTRTSSTARTSASSRRSADARSSFARSTSAATSCRSADFPTEPNPFLGWRAIRMCLDQPELFGVQLRALLRAAVHGDVRIMLPLVVTLDEVRRARELLDEAARELEARGVEVPSRRSARRDDRDAGGRGRRATRSSTTSRSSASARTIWCSTRSPSIAATRTSRAGSRRCIPRCCKLIRRTVVTAHEHDLDVAVCGEMASQPLMAVRAHRTRRAAAERRATIGAARQANRARHFRRGGRRGGERRAASRRRPPKPRRELRRRLARRARR